MPPNLRLRSLSLGSLTSAGVLEVTALRGAPQLLQAPGARPLFVSSTSEVVGSRVWESGLEGPLQMPPEGLGWQVLRNLPERVSMNRLLGLRSGWGLLGGEGLGGTLSS